MRHEFDRYQLGPLRPVVGWLQLAAAGGQLLGLYLVPLGSCASGGLMLMMVFAVGVRLKIGDPAIKCVPAGSYAILEMCLLIASIRR